MTTDLVLERANITLFALAGSSKIVNTHKFVLVSNGSHIFLIDFVSISFSSLQKIHSISYI